MNGTYLILRVFCAFPQKTLYPARLLGYNYRFILNPNILDHTPTADDR